MLSNSDNRKCILYTFCLICAVVGYFVCLYLLLGVFIANPMTKKIFYVIFNAIVLLILCRCLGMAMMYPGSFRFTSANIQVAESSHILNKNQMILSQIFDTLERFQQMSLQMMKMHMHQLCVNQLKIHLQFMNFYFKETELSEKKSKLRHHYENIESLLELQENEESLTLGNILLNPRLVTFIEPADEMGLKEKSKLVRENIKQILSIMKNYHISILGKRFFDISYTLWFLYAEKYFSIQSFFLYWNYDYDFKRQIITIDKIDLECAIIQGRKGRPLDSRKAVMFHNPNGAYMQIFGIKNNMIFRFLDNDYQVILWNYRGYGKSMGSPGIIQSQKDAQAIYQHYSNELSIEVMFGISIGGCCAIYLAHKYPDIKYLIADRTFSSLENAALGFIQGVEFQMSERKWNMLRYFCYGIVKLVMYSDCMDISQLYLRINCKKLMVWDVKDEIIVNSASLKQRVIETAFNGISYQTVSSEQTLKAIEDSNAKQKAMNQMKKKNIVFDNEEQIVKGKMKNFFFNKKSLSQQFIEDFIKRIEELKKKCPFNLSRQIFQILEEVDGGGVSLWKNLFEEQFTEKTKRKFKKNCHSFILGLLTFGCKSQTPNFQVKQITIKILRQKISALQDLAIQIKIEEGEAELRAIIKIFSFILQKLEDYSFIGQEGYLLVTNCGHNGDLTRKNKKYIFDFINLD